MGIPSVVLPNRNGKTHAFVEAWTAEIDGVGVATSADEALAMARGWVAS
jgi:hypothetical protein